LIDPKNWSEVARKSFRGGEDDLPRGVLRAGNGRMWVHYPDHRVEVRDVSTLDVIWSHDRIVASTPSLAGKIHAIYRGPGGERLVVTGNDGRRFALDPTTQSSELYDGGDLGGIDSYLSDLCVSLRMTGKSGATYTMVPVAEGSARFALFVRPSEQADAVRAGDEERIGARICFVDEETGGLLVRHDATMDSRAKVLLSRVSLEGKAVWTVPLGEGPDVAFVARIGDHAVLITERPYATLYLFDWKTGTIVRQETI
jgi:hypothetical protein